MVQEIKEKLCFVSKKQDADVSSSLQSIKQDKQYVLPDKKKLQVSGLIRKTVPELMFQPSIDGY